MPPTLNGVINLVIRRVVLEKILKPEPLPVEVFGAASDQLRHVFVESESLWQGQGFNRFFDFVQRFAHDFYCPVKSVFCKPYRRIACFSERSHSTGPAPFQQAAYSASR